MSKYFAMFWSGIDGNLGVTAADRSDTILLEHMIIQKTIR